MRVLQKIAGRTVNIADNEHALVNNPELSVYCMTVEILEFRLDREIEHRVFSKGRQTPHRDSVPLLFRR